MAARPKDRRAQIRATAAELFTRHGYHNVSVADVSEALGIAPSALYHHFRNKQDLLLHAVLGGLDALDDLVQQSPDLDAAIVALVELVLGPPGVLAIWEREARTLDPDQRDTIRTREREVVGHLAEKLRASRPDLGDPAAQLLARAVLGTLGSRPQRGLSLSRREDERLLHELAWAAARAHLPDPVPGAGTSIVPPSWLRTAVRRPRRDQLLTQAIRLFDERGYQSVTMTDIGEAAGIVASGVYRHYSSKTDLLVAAIHRGGEQLRTAIEGALAGAANPAEALTHMLQAHITVSVEHRHTIGLLMNEADQLPDKERLELRRFNADYLDVWVQALAAAIPGGHESTELKMAVHAVHSMIYYVVRTSPDVRLDTVRPGLTAVGVGLLLRRQPASTSTD